MERGFIQGKLEIKFLLLYILGRAESPLSLDALTDVALCDDGVTYFDFSVALSELVDTQHVLLERGQYSLTEKGRRNGAITADQVPYSVRMKCDVRMGQINAQLRRERRIRSELAEREEGGWRVKLALDGEEEPERFQLAVTVPLQEDGLKLIARFRADPEGFVREITGIQ
ncbi:MAG: DUF4364 family protein [Oscillospiraceae bacterium]|nr:DUF4364 family protein [Oscillospiraceae bacterium]